MRPGEVRIGVSVDPDRCQGAMHCSYLAPEAFVTGADGVSRAVDPTPLTDPDLAIRIAEECPNHAVRLTLDGERYPS